METETKKTTLYMIPTGHSSTKVRPKFSLGLSSIAYTSHGKCRDMEHEELTFTTGTMAKVVSGCIWTLVATLFCTWPLSAPALASSYSMVNASRPVSSRTASVSTISNTQSKTSWTLDTAQTHYYWPLLPHTQTRFLRILQNKFRKNFHAIHCYKFQPLQIF